MSFTMKTSTTPSQDALMARIPAETTRTLLVVGSLTVAGVGLLKNAYWKENSDGTWFFQDIVALSCETESKIMLEDLGERVAWFRNLPAVGQDNYVEILADLFAKIRERIEGVTHVVFTDFYPVPRKSKCAQTILRLCKHQCDNLKYCLSIFGSDSEALETLSLFQQPEVNSDGQATPLEGLKWAELQYDVILGFSAGYKGYVFETLHALCIYVNLKKLNTPKGDTPAVPFPEWAAYDTVHSFIDQDHAANLVLHVLEDLEGTAGYHAATVSIAAANEPLRWRDIWPTICASMKCDPVETLLEHEAIPSVDSAKNLVQMNKDDWNHAFTNDWKRLQPRKYPWPSLSEEGFAAFWLKLAQHRQDTNLDINFLRDKGYFGSRTLQELCIAVRKSIDAMREHGLLPKEGSFSAEKKHFQATRQPRDAGGAP